MAAQSPLSPSSAPALAARHLSLVLATYVIVGSTVSLAGWWGAWPRLIDWWATGITIKANAAVSLLAASVALACAIVRPSTIFIRALGILTATIGGLTALEHLTGWNLGIDTLLFDEPKGAAGTVAPGRMGPPASASLVAIGAALFLMTSRSARRVSVWLGLGVIVIATLSLIGYWYGAEAMYTVPRLTGIAIQTATMLAALGIAIVTAQPDIEPTRTLIEDTNAGILARRLLPAAFAIPLALGWLRIEGQRLELYDYAFGTALRTVAELTILAGVLWWAVQAIRWREAQRQRLERERQSSEQRMRLVLGASAVPFTILSPVRNEDRAVVDFTCSYLNASAAAALRHSAAEFIGRSISQVLPGTWNQPGLLEHYTAVATLGEVREFEFASTYNGIEGWFHVIASPLEGDVAVWFADVSERKRQELELRMADRRKDEFLATLAHELRNPLAPIRQAAALSKRAGITAAQRQWCNDIIERQVQHMSLLLDDLLDVSRITRGILQLRRQPTELSSLIESAVETARPLIEGKRHTLNLDVPRVDVQLDVDPLRMSQIISNLLNNAAKYTNSGGTIQLSAQLCGSDLVLKVMDNGIGIIKEELSTIFNMFSQSKSAHESSEGGLGIGLALTRGLVELHGGSIVAESAGPGTGSIFTLTIPAVVIAQASHDDEVVAPQPQIPPRRILLADDNRDAAKTLSMLLAMDGHEVVLAHDGEEAVRLFDQHRPAVALLDIGMPRLDGYAAARRIRDLDNHALLIAITGWGQSSDRDKSAAAGFDHHLTKPVTYTALAQLLSQTSEPSLRASAT